MSKVKCKKCGCSSFRVSCCPVLFTPEHKCNNCETVYHGNQEELKKYLSKINDFAEAVSEDY